MNTKKLGMAIIVLSLAVAALFVFAASALRQDGIQQGCFPTQDCLRIESTLGLVHVAIGVVSFFLALGFYMVFFYGGEQAILRRLEAQQTAALGAEKFAIMLRMLDPHEQAVLQAIRAQDGITQASLTLRTGLSKSKLSEILTRFEKKKLIGREKEGRTRRIHLIEAV